MRSDPQFDNRVRPTLRYRLECAITSAIAILDRMDGDPDYEPTADWEPNLAGSNTDLERDPLDEAECDGLSDGELDASEGAL